MSETAVPTPPKETTPPPLPLAWVATVFVWGVWAFLLVVNVVMIAQYSIRRLPLSDEIGEAAASLSLEWLWAQHAEHRIPLAKLIWLGVLKLTNFDFAVGNYLQVLATGAVAAGMIATARGLRGETRFTDVFFPLAVLNLGQTQQTFLWWWQVNHTLGPLMAYVLLLVLVRAGPQPSPRSALLTGLMLLVLALSGPAGLPYVPFLALGLIGWGVHYYWSNPEARGTWAGRLGGAVPLGLVGGAVLLTGLYFVGYDKSQDAGQHESFTWSGIQSTLEATTKLLSLSIGTVTTPHWLFWGLAVLTLWLVSAAGLVVAWRRLPAERMRFLGLFLFLAAAGSLLLTLGWARARLGDSNLMAGHYLSKGVPALCCAYFVWILYGERHVGNFMQAVFSLVLGMTCVLMLHDWKQYWHGMAENVQFAEQCERDLLNGESPQHLFHRHRNVLGLQQIPEDLAVYWFKQLRQAQVGAFRHLKDAVPHWEISFSSAPGAVNMTLKDGAWVATGDNPCLVYDLGQPQFIQSIRLKLTYPEAAGRTFLFWMSWKQGDQAFGELGKSQRAFFAYLTSAEEHSLVVPINDTIDCFCIGPDLKPCTIKLTEIRLALPFPEQEPPDNAP